jgi:hypothetical protein
MLIVLFLFIFSGFANDVANAQYLVVSGNYQGKNLYVQNPFTSNMKDFCTDEVYLNEVKIMDNIKSSAFEIDLSSLNLNDPVTVKIVHKDDCKPKVLNAQVIRTANNFQFLSFNVTEDEISWSTKGEKLGDKIFIEQYLYNNWVTIKEVPAKGSASSNHYNFPSNNHSGLNKYRIRFVEKEGSSYYSKTVEIISSKPEVTFFPKRVANKIYLSRAVDYEIVDGYGNPLIKGKGSEIVCEKLPEGVYYLNVDNKTEKFLKK